MARDSSPFAKRLKKAISQRPAGQAQDADPSAQEQPAVEPLAPMEVQPQSGAAPDEQPTGEFPAIEATDVVGGPVPDRPVQPYGQASAAHVADDEQPTGDVPAVEPGWLDPPAADPITPASIIGVDQTGAPEGDSAHRVDWSPPADDVFEPTPAPPAESSGPVSPYLPDPPAPIWETEAAEASSSSDAPLPIWESIDTPAEGATPAQAPSTDDTTPAWAQEAEAIGESSGPVVPPPLSGYDAPTASPAASTAPDGPTLSPPVLPKKTHPEDAPSAIEPAEDASPTEAPGDQSGEADIAATVTSSVDSSTDEAAPTAQTEDAPSTRDAHEAALAALPDESEPEWTPTALHEALSLDEDEADDAPKSAATSDDSTADADSASTADEAEAEPTPVEEPTPAPAAKRGLRSPFGRRKRETSAAATTDALPSGVADTDEAAPAPTPEPETSIHAAVPAPAEDTTVDERNAESDVDPVASTTSADEPEQNATDSTVDGPDEPSVDPGSITSRFAAIGRRALSRKEAKAAAAAAAAQA
ncbi:MAG: hypothetical protein Q7T55_25795, partial [Solirubrobacteraceae bacterium]|nr:hypothetical protein [Solirubrobacteraceae bacterium]